MGAVAIGRVRSAVEERDSLHDPRPRVVLRPYASALPLGLLSFAVGMVLIAGIGVHWVTGSEVATAGLAMMVFVFPLEFVAAVLAFLSRDVGTATALGLFSTSWIATGLTHLLAPPGSTSTATGMFLLAFALVLVAPAVAAAPVRPLLTVILGVSIVRAVTGGVYQLLATSGWSDAEGVSALVLAVIAVYAGSAFLLEDARGQPVLPTGRLGNADRALHGSLDAQVDQVAHEAGVRQQL